jgi:hypothetical protein
MSAATPTIAANTEEIAVGWTTAVLNSGQLAAAIAPCKKARTQGLRRRRCKTGAASMMKAQEGVKIPEDFMLSGAGENQNEAHHKRRIRWGPMMEPYRTGFTDLRAA